MFGSFIIAAFLLAGAICLIGIAAFMWLNARDASRDNRSYGHHYDVEKDISPQYRYRGEESINPAEALKQYAMPGKRQNEAVAKMTVKNPPTQPASVVNDPDVIEAEVVEDSAGSS